MIVFESSIDLAQHLLTGWTRTLDPQVPERDAVWISPDHWGRCRVGPNADRAVVRTYCDGAVADYERRRRQFDPLPFAMATLPDWTLTTPSNVQVRFASQDDLLLPLQRAATESMVRLLSERVALTGCLVCFAPRGDHSALCKACGAKWASVFDNDASLWRWIMAEREVRLQALSAIHPFRRARAALPLEWRNFQPDAESMIFYHPECRGERLQLWASDIVSFDAAEFDVPERDPVATARMLLPDHLWSMHRDHGAEEWVFTSGGLTVRIRSSTNHKDAVMLCRYANRELAAERGRGRLSIFAPRQAPLLGLDWSQQAANALGRQLLPGWTACGDRPGVPEIGFSPPDANLHSLEAEDIVNTAPKYDGGARSTLVAACYEALRRYEARQLRGPLLCKGCGADVGKGFLVDGLCEYCSQRKQLAHHGIEEIRRVDAPNGIERIQPASEPLGLAWQSPTWEEP